MLQTYGSLVLLETPRKRLLSWKHENALVNEILNIKRNDSLVENNRKERSKRIPEKQLGFPPAEIVDSRLGCARSVAVRFPTCFPDLSRT